MSIAEKLLQAKEDLDTVYKKGKDAAMQAFAYAYQHNPATGQPYTDYYNKFVQSGWKDITFAYIKYPIVCKGSTTAAIGIFARCSITHIDVPITIEGCTAQETFYYAQWLEEIADITFINVPSFTRTFTGCTRLRHMIVKGSIDVVFWIGASAELDEESVDSIITALKDLTGQTTQTLTFHATVGEKLSEEQKAVITAKNWTLAY